MSSHRTPEWLAKRARIPRMSDLAERARTLPEDQLTDLELWVKYGDGDALDAALKAHAKRKGKMHGIDN